jgi:hypothetical protein
VDVEAHGGTPQVRYFFYTDLPAGTKVILSCQRTYTNTQGERCVWVGRDEAVLTEPSVQGTYSGARGQIDVVGSDRRAFERFKQIRSAFSPDIASAVSDVLSVILTAGARQPLKEFGRNNAHLSGQLVRRRGDVNIVQVSKDVKVPVRKECQPIEKEREK